MSFLYFTLRKKREPLRRDFLQYLQIKKCRAHTKMEHALDFSL